ncbi:hypothetical protein IQ279_26925 [Streptomyces verrucosisporus]|uniref:hypothetical protein n=1 Tax=Streptomyces verrucosisporus TaxID=1695161 RepID=UPI0019D0B9D5|nr:hypothetical protein [Streptomyces verrucosisporus]MBN3933192.1 hypothetical protein [Streptomyces verrucosisporus]
MVDVQAAGAGLGSAVPSHEETTSEDPLRQEETVVVLVGTTIATFNMLDVDGSASFPPDLIDIQVDRLERAQRR